jgi:hypothetical protein
MHINDKGNVSMLNLNYNYRSKALKHLLDIQQQGYPTPILHNITICITQLVLYMDVTSSQIRDTNLVLLIMNLVVFLSSMFICSFHLPTNPHKPMFLGTYQCFKT